MKLSGSLYRNRRLPEKTITARIVNKHARSDNRRRTWRLCLKNVQFPIYSSSALCKSAPTLFPPPWRGEKYVEFCLDFCNAHGIDVFIPKREMLKISEQRKNFEDIGVKVMVDSYQIVSVLNHKEAAYEYFKNNEIGLVPAH